VHTESEQCAVIVREQPVEPCHIESLVALSYRTTNKAAAYFQEADQFFRKISLFKVEGKQRQSGHREQALL
jgi:hypothetical protein